jgi:hypothetical protein
LPIFMDQDFTLQLATNDAYSKTRLLF